MSGVRQSTITKWMVLAGLGEERLITVDTVVINIFNFLYLYFYTFFPFLVALPPNGVATPLIAFTVVLEKLPVIGYADKNEPKKLATPNAINS